MPTNFGKPYSGVARPRGQKSFFSLMRDIARHHKEKFKRWLLGGEPLSMKWTYVALIIVPLSVILAWKLVP